MERSLVAKILHLQKTSLKYLSEAFSAFIAIVNEFHRLDAAFSNFRISSSSNITVVVLNDLSYFSAMGYNALILLSTVIKSFFSKFLAA